MEYFNVFYQSLFSIIALLILTKLLGYRQVSQFSMFDYINGITIGSIAAEMAIDLEGNFLKPLLAMVVYAVFVILLSKISQKSIPLRRLINGKAIMLYQDGKIYNENLRKAKMDVDEFLVECRVNGYFDLSQIESAVLEPNGKISFLPVTEDRPATPKDLGIKPAQEEIFANIIIDGHIMKENLKHVGRDQNWLNQQLDGQNIKKPEDVFLAICDKQGNFYAFPKMDHLVDKDILG
ncbi:MAG: DUF421 domain-containing protein [Lachnospiraceae bacterium]|nr:DUF421 domain-containing protein [Lachnospiraceae bacterium]MDE6760630.1 DUF421 domain-containing protein [Lachnospiraceae bacterium]